MVRMSEILSRAMEPGGFGGKVLRLASFLVLALSAVGLAYGA